LGVEVEKFSIETAPFSLAVLIQEAVDLATAGAPQWRRGILRLVDPLLPDKVIGDSRRLRQVLENLLLAATSLTHGGGIKLSVFSAVQRRHELEIVFEITSTDCRLTESQVEHCLSLGTNGDGNLFLARKLARSLGGEMGSQCDVGMPAIFWIRIPLQSSSSLSSESSALRPPATTDTSQASRYSVRILMAEDNRINQRVGKLILQKAGYAIDLVSDGIEALEAHRQTPYDLILMDCQMPAMDGFEATRQIRALDTPQPVIVAVTANALVGERERCLAAGMDDYLSKPFQADQLISIVAKWAGRQENGSK
jgi:CheY-like chemotaxis protein